VAQKAKLLPMPDTLYNWLVNPEITNIQNIFL